MNIRGKVEMYTYSQHEMIEPPVVMGEKLLPLCLGHIDVLCGLESPVVRGEAPSLSDIGAMLFVCGRSPTKARRQIRSGRALKWMKRSGRRISKMPGEKVGAAERELGEYFKTYSMAPPRWETGGETPKERAPWHLCIFMALQKQTNYTPDECWNMPLARALELFAAICANAGDTGLVTAQEMDVFDAMQGGGE